MLRTMTIASVVCVILCTELQADEQVTLKSGTRIIGSVTLDGSNVNIKLGDSQLVVPLSEIDMIATVGIEAKHSPERLLMIALEARAQHGTSAGQVGLLAEAYRLAPQDSRIAYWYAQSLADAGLGSAAHGVLQKHRTAIDSELPGLSRRLAIQIEERMAIENLPPRLAARVEQLNKSADAMRIGSNEIPMFVRFRLTDSTGKTVARSAIRVNCSGSDERLEAFEGGYYLFTFNSYRNNDDPNCRLVVNSPGLEQKEFPLQPAADHVANAGNLVVKRYGDNDKVSLTFVVTDHTGKGVADASVTLRPQDGEGGDGEQTASTDSEGRVTFTSFPMNYIYTVAAKGFTAERGGVELKRDSQEREPQRVKLYPAISAMVRLAWSARPLVAVEGSVTSQHEATLEIGDGISSQPYRPDTMPVLQLAQVGETLVLQNGPPYFGGLPALSTWIRRAPRGANDVSLESIDLEKIEDLKDWESVEQSGGPSRGAMLSFEVKEGDVIVGQLPGRDMRTGQPSQVSFKAYVEKVSKADESQ